MAMQKIKKDDQVIIIAGKDKGRSGKVIRLMPKNRILVEGINLLKKCVKPNPNKGEQGGILEREGGLHISNVALFNPTTKKADRVGFKNLKDGKKVRCFKSNDEMIDV